MKNHGLARSHISVLVDDEDVFKRELGSNLKEEQVLSDAKGGATLLSRNTVEEEEKLPEEHVTEDVDASKEVQPSHFTKLDQLLTQAHLFSEMVMEKMDDIDRTGPENDTKDTITLERDVEDVKEKKKGRGSKRKAPTNFNSRKVTRAVGAMLARSTEGPVSEDLRNYKEDKMAEEQAELVPLLTGGRLKPYQIKGVKWLISLWQNGLNGILADEMGLGKTLQTIAFLAHLKGNGLHGPYLVIAPLSTLSNWAEEISRFVPSMNAVIYHGNSKIRSEIRRKHMPRNISAEFPIVITSYEVAMIDARKYLKFYHWKYIVVDEGHRLKNSECKLLSELKLLPVENKLLLSGTPLQNNLKELWSLLNFILPDVFPSVTEFESWFNFFGESNNDNVQKEVLEKRRTRVVAKLHSILRPFLLRRMKEDVEQMLPRKKEIILYATLSEHQKVFQDHLLNKTLESHLQEVKNGYGMKGKLQNLMVQLRKNCNHPDLIASEFNHSDDYPPVDQIVEQCGKFQLLDKLVKQLLSRKHKVLIFSQWTKILDIMDYYFSEINMEVFRIDGSVELPERQRQIQEFQDVNSNCRIFLLSTRAGGMGINLTAADSCILYDSDWNPQMDLQAMNRCHRIGQTKPVHVYRLATAQSVEGRILKRAFSKLRLEHVVIGKGQFMQEVNRSKITDIEEEEDVLALLRDQEDEEDKMIQTTISDADLERVLDRSDLVAGTEKEDGKPQFLESVIPLKGPGWEVVVPPTSGGMLTTVNN